MAQLASNPARAERRLSWGAGLLVWIVLGLHLVPGGGVNPNRYFDLTHSLVNQHSLNIDLYQDNTVDKAYYQGHYYIAALPGASILAMPAYVIFKGLYALTPKSWLTPIQGIKSFQADSTSGFYAQQDTTEFFLSTVWITWWTLALLSALATVCLVRLLRLLGFSLAISLAGALLYAFGTNVFFFSTTYFSHGLASAFVIFALYWCVRIIDPARRSAQTFGLIGGCAALSLLIEYGGGIFLVGLALYCLWLGGRRALGFYALGALLPCLILVAYNTLLWGVPWADGHEYIIRRAWNVHDSGLLGFTLPSLDRLWGMTFSPERGLFLYSPVLILAPLGWVWAWQRARSLRGFYLLLAGLAAATFLYNLCYADWRGGASFGLRFVIPSLVCWIIGTVYACRRVPALIWVPLATLAVLQNWMGAQYGFTSSIFDTWHQFFTAGPTLPVLAAILDHAAPGNSLRSAILAYQPWIMLGYVLLIAGLALALYRQIRVSHRPAGPMELPA